MKITEHLNETFAAARESDHDDLVMCVGMACWVAEHLPGPLPDPRELVLNEPPGADPDGPQSRLDEIARDLPHLFRDD